MAAILLRILLAYNLLNTILLYLIPKKLRIYLPSSWYPSPSPSASNLLEEPISPPSKTCRRMDAAELKRVFEMFDQNGDGQITKEELNDSLEKMGIFIPDAELSQTIEKIDVNADGCVDIDEFDALYQTIMNEKGEDEDMRDAFNVFDQNGDGFITVDELKSILASLGLNQGRTAEDCKKMIMKVDVDGDGVVNFAEFRQMMKGSVFTALI